MGPIAFDGSHSSASFCNVLLLGSSGLQPGLLGQGGCLVGGLPGALWLAAAEVAIGCGLLVARAGPVHAFDNPLRREREVLANQLGQLGLANPAGAEGLNANADRIGNANGVSQLNFCPLGQAGGNDVFGDVARHVSRAAVDLRRIFSRESAAAVTPGSAVGVHDDFAAGEPGLAHGSPDHKSSRRIDVVLGVLVEPLRRQHRLDNVLQNVGVQFLVRHTLRVLAADNNGVDARGLAILVVLHRDLALAVGAQVGQLAALADRGQLAEKLVGQRNRSGHQLGGFVGGVAEHHALIAGAAGVNALRNVAGLLIDGGDDGAGVGVEAVKGVVISDGGDDTADKALEIDVSLGGDFAGNNHQACGRKSFGGYAAVGVLLQACVKDSVRDLVGYLVGMAFSH